MEEVKLMGALPSPFSYRVRWALKMKGVEYQYIQEDLFNKSPLLLQSNPIHKKVPVLLHGGKAIPESLVILEYIEDTWKHNPILPENPSGRATTRFWAKFSDEKCLASIWSAFCSRGEEQEKHLECAWEALKILDKELDGKRFFGGETIGFVDLVAGWMGHWFNVLEQVAGFKLSDPLIFPSLHGWMDRFLNVPIIKENLPSPEEMLLFFRTVRIQLKLD